MSPLDSPNQHTPLQERWGEALDAGFLVVPVTLLRHQKALRLTDGAMVVLLNILAAWWYESRLPFPSTKTIADRMGVTTRSVQRHLASLEKRGLIRRLRNQAGSDGLNVLVTRYDPAGLVERLKGLTSETYPKRKAGQGGATAAVAAAP
jgi:predicted transcriptional regulator